MIQYKNFNYYLALQQIPLTGNVELKPCLLSGGMNKLGVRRLHKPPQKEKQTNSIPVRESQHSDYVIPFCPF